MRPTPTNNHRWKLGTETSATFDPWGDHAVESTDDLNPADNNPEHDRRTTDTWADATDPQGATITPAAVTPATITPAAVTPATADEAGSAASPTAA